MILIPFLISMLYCCAFATFLVSILYFCDFATFSDFKMMLLWFCYLFSFEFYLFIYNMILMWFWYDIVAQASAQSVTFVPLIKGTVGFDVPMKPRKLRQAQGRWRCSRCKAGLDSNNEPIEKGDGAALEPGRLPRAKKGSVKCLLFLFAILFLLFLLVQNILGPCWRVGKWLCGLCGWWYRVVKFILFSSALFISYLETRDNAKSTGWGFMPPRNINAQLHNSTSQKAGLERPKM